MPIPSIIAEQLVYRYGSLLAVDQISFQVASGEIFGFLGPNGAGKSTTVKMLTGQLRPQAGQIKILGIDVARHPKQVQARIGVCFELTNLYETMSGVENLHLFARLFGVRGFDADALLRRVGLDGRGKDKVEGYSKGMKQRLMVARALVNQPDVLFLDEPTEGLDPTSAQAIRHVIREEQARGATIFLTTHDMHEADLLCDRVAFLDRGTIVALDTPHTLKQQYGERMVYVEVLAPDGTLQRREVMLDRADTPAEVAALLQGEQVVTLHSAEATLEDIFIRITGRGLAS
ncbi:ABC transporter ATP-binding protein [Candidatus Chloroploca asiatica]|uniref:Multidrug ABC transporter ATP-binding protein n=1 Tax=Candidatus Chloroploca asiatica TaxID=1506545 RepID=A0A2H3KNK1_9CHLR|nr:ABC transporter ATP-binding protein [Candidatus Chloroploca asiatica]PDV99766.1 multidrug ABC transporter ATP-binding protein [Candidatus Chloroploca asiatica]